MATSISKSFREFKLTQIPRDSNKHADALANLGSTIPSSRTRAIPIIRLQDSVLTTAPVHHVRAIYRPDDWRSPIYRYLDTGELPDDLNEARRIKQRASRYRIFRNELYRWSFAGIYQKCLGPDDSEYALRETHEGECGNHSGSRSLVRNLLRAGYFWPKMQQDAQKLVSKCDKCQRFAPALQQHPEFLHSLTPVWPFMRWGMDIVGKLPPAPGKRVFLLMVTDYFTKWIEAGAFQQVKEPEVIDFIWKNVVCRFGLPYEIVCDNGSQFIGSKFRKFCTKWNIKLKFSTPRNPQSNGQAEASNKTIVSSLKKRLEKAKGKWADELPAVLWAYRTTARTPTGETPFSLTYGSEAMIPVEFGLPSLRYKWTNEEINNINLNYELDLLDLKREQALIRMASYQQQIARQYNKHVKERRFQVGELVLRKVFPNTPESRDGKLSPNWEGPYQIESITGPGSYQLRDSKGKLLPRSWNVIHLKKVLPIASKFLFL